VKTSLTTLLLVAVACARGADDPEPPDPKGKDLKALQGSWGLHSLKLMGNEMPIPMQGDKAITFVISKQRVKMMGGAEKAKELAIKLDPKKKPGHIDLTEAGAKKTVKGIYKVEKEMLYLCFRVDNEGKERPKGFDDDKAATMIFKKETKK
jgi:uncharacterized protein (TIGR03067 family)